MLKRQTYLNWLISSKDNEFIKVITGVRRSGKSVILRLYQDYLLEQGVLAENIIFYNFEHPDNFGLNSFAGSKLIPKLGETLLFGVEDFGQGHVVYMVDNPLFRGFWENGKMIFGNAIFMVGQD